MLSGVSEFLIEERSISDTNGKQCAIASDLEEPLRKIVRGSFPAVLRSLRLGQPDLWRWGKSVPYISHYPFLTAQILCHSTEKNYILTNLPWLIGSLGTMAEDMMIFVQFHLYAVRDPPSVAVA